MSMLVLGLLGKQHINTQNHVNECMKAIGRELRGTGLKATVSQQLVFNVSKHTTYIHNHKFFLSVSQTENRRGDCSVLFMCGTNL